jgi:FMN phosphatase YigB (HAD superfamily)
VESRNSVQGNRPFAVVFDLFNAVVDPEDYRPRDFNTIAKIAELFNLESKAFEKYWSDSAQIRNTSRSRKPLDLIEDYVSQNNGRAPTKGDLLIVDTLLGRYYDVALQNPKSDVVVSLHNLKYQGLKLGVLSNTSSREISTWFRSPLSGVFEKTGFSCNSGFAMPSKEAYNDIVAQIGMTPGNCVFVGGKEKGSLKGARDAGFGKVIFMKGFAARHHLLSAAEMAESENLADSTILRISELVELLKASPAQVV